MVVIPAVMPAIMPAVMMLAMMFAMMVAVMTPMVMITTEIPLPPPPTIRLPIMVLAVGPIMRGLCGWSLHGERGQHTKGYG
jgi:hypothetical protein